MHNVLATPTSQPPKRATQNYTKTGYLYILITPLLLNKYLNTYTTNITNFSGIIIFIIIKVILFLLKNNKKL